MGDSVELDSGIEPPNTILTELIGVYQRLFSDHPELNAMEPITVLAKLLNEPGNEREIARFVESFVVTPDPYEMRKGMIIMICLGYLFARGEKKLKWMVK